MLDRNNYENVSILRTYFLTLDKYRQYYQHEEIDGATRKLVSLIPEDAFREDIANALVHRTLDVNAQIKISMFDDHIKITSPGGLPKGLSKEEYLSGQISILRNPIIANVFFRLGIIEQFGTGVKRIINSYQNSIVKPNFSIFENSITISLPVVQASAKGLSKDENKVYQSLQDENLSTAEIVAKTGFGRTKTLKLINDLIKKCYLNKLGKGRSTVYSKNK